MLCCAIRVEAARLELPVLAKRTLYRLLLDRQRHSFGNATRSNGCCPSRPARWGRLGVGARRPPGEGVQGLRRRREECPLTSELSVIRRSTDRIGCHRCRLEACQTSCQFRMILIAVSWVSLVR